MSFIASLLTHLTWSNLLVILFGYVVFTYFTSWYRLRHFRGPWLGTLSKLWICRSIRSGKNHLELEAISRKYGPLARVGPNELLTSDPDLLHRMNGARSQYTRGEWYDGLKIDPHRHTVFTLRDEEKHTEMRGKMASGYAGKENPTLEPDIDAQVQSLIDLLETRYLSTTTTFRPVDLARKVQFFTLDVITMVAFGEPFGNLKRDADCHKYIETTEKMLPMIVLATALPWIISMMGISWIGMLILPKAEDEYGLGKMIGVAQRVVAERFGPDRKVRQDMLNSFIRHGLTQQELEGESLVQIMAGSDTTATAIRATLLHLLTSPTAQTRLLAEILPFKTKGPIVSSAEARSLPYLQACIKEGLRIWPPVTGLLSKKAGPHGDVYTDPATGKEMVIPPGTNVGYSAWAIHHSKAVFGEDAEIFRPDRWLEAQGEQLRRMEKSVELIFGHGRFQCLGRSVAMMELDKVFFGLFRRFDMQVVDPTRVWKSINCSLWLQSEMWVRVSRREGWEEHAMV